MVLRRDVGQDLLEVGQELFKNHGLANYEGRNVEKVALIWRSVFQPFEALKQEKSRSSGIRLRDLEPELPAS